MSKVNTISITKIVPDENQPRKYFDAKKMATLRASIKRDGILNPLIVEPEKNGKHILIDGERRFRAALEEGFKEVPYIILETESDQDRLIQQFQIQEMHEGWTAGEKASAIEKLATEMGTDIRTICQMLNIGHSVTKKYVAYSFIMEKANFIKSETPIEWASYINGVKSKVKYIYNDKFKKPFEKSDEKSLEAAMFRRIRERTINKTKDFIKIKDAFTKNPDFIKKFIETNITPEGMFYESKAQGAFHLRNISLHAGYIDSHISRFLELKDVKPSELDINRLKIAQKQIKALLDKVE